MRPMTKSFDSIYTLICQEITMGEQKIIFGTVGLKNILDRYGKDDAIRMASDYIERRNING